MKLVFLIFLSIIILNSCCNTGHKEESTTTAFNTRYTYMEYDTFPKKLVEIIRYNGHQQKLERIQFSRSTGLVISLAKYKYDTLNRLEKTIVFNNSSSKIHTWINFHSNHLDSTECYIDTQLVQSIYYTYNDKGLLIEERTSSNANNTESNYVFPNEITRYTYNALDSVVKSEYYDYSGQLLGIDTFYYEKGKKIQKEIYPNIPVIECGSQSASPVKYSYEYKNELHF